MRDFSSHDILLHMAFSIHPDPNHNPNPNPNLYTNPDRNPNLNSAETVTFFMIKGRKMNCPIPVSSIHFVSTHSILSSTQ